MSTERPLVVTFVTRVLTQYRVAFHERVRALLQEHGVTYRLVQGQPDAEETARGDLATLPWADVVHNRALFGRGKLVWQPILKIAFASDLVVIGQENQLLINYPLQMIPAKWRPKLALWGHGRNFQSRNPDSKAERWKRLWVRRCDWWFAYTEETRRCVESLGYPADRITVFNNAVDTAKLRDSAERVTPTRLAARRAELGLSGENVAVYVGGIYDDKRPDFLIAASDMVRAAVPDFELVIVGGGVSLPVIQAAAVTRPWLKVMGPRFGDDKAELMLLGKLFLMPGLLGLAVLDAGALGLPVVTTRYPWHSPEIAYLKDGETGVIVDDWQSERAYADAIVALLANEPRRSVMSANARRHAQGFTIEAMADRFAQGVCEAVFQTPKLQRNERS